LQFQYIYASDEYPEFCGSEFIDPMAIFVSTNHVGTNWVNSITNDIALVPGTTNVPVNVYTINGGHVGGEFGDYVSPVNPQYYIDNHDPDPDNRSSVPPYETSAPIYNLQYDGFTTLLTNAQAHISANVTNHIKIGIEDGGGDRDIDSAIFIKTTTFSCP
jgi:hypothetical protein